MLPRHPSSGRRSLWVLLVAAAASACHHGATTAASPMPAGADLTGVWAYDAAASQGGPGARGEGGRGGYGGGGHGRGGGMGGGMGGGRGMPGGGGGGSGERGPGARRDTAMGGMFRPPLQFAIVQTDSTLTVRPENGTPVTLYFDGRSVAVPLHGNETEEIAGHWHDKRYDVVRRVGDITVAESYERSKDGSKLVVHSKVTTGERTGQEMVRTYDWVRRE